VIVPRTCVAKHKSNYILYKLYTLIDEQIWYFVFNMREMTPRRLFALWERMVISSTLDCQQTTMSMLQTDIFIKVKDFFRCDRLSWLLASS